tara:strand:+ start:5332 stop:6327 length:996 start_codon:yes stop_codon:yes gene_type:complete
MTRVSLLEFFTQFHFLRPGWLLLLPIAVLIYLALGRRYSSERIWRGLIAAHLLQHLRLNHPRGWQLEPRATLSLGLALSALALAGPAWERQLSPLVEDRAPLIIALDVGQSMNAVDIAPTRLARSKQKIRDLLALRQGARTALIVYAGSAHIVLALTDDMKILSSYLDALSSEIMPHDGKQTGAALRLADSLLAKEPGPGSVLLITDGIEAGASTATAHADLLIWPMGSAAGGAIRLANGEFAKAADGSRLIARLDNRALSRFAETSNATLIQTTLGPEDVLAVQRRIQAHFLEAGANGNQARWVDAGYWLLWPIVLLAGLAFRPGWAVRW